VFQANSVQQQPNVFFEISLETGTISATRSGAQRRQVGCSKHCWSVWAVIRSQWEVTDFCRYSNFAACVRYRTTPVTAISSRIKYKQSVIVQKQDVVPWAVCAFSNRLASILCFYILCAAGVNSEFNFMSRACVCRALNMYLLYVIATNCTFVRNEAYIVLFHTSHLLTCFGLNKSSSRRLHRKEKRDLG
jgi:hypothetical protein